MKSITQIWNSASGSVYFQTRSGHPDIQLRAEEIELRDRNSVLRSSNGGKIHVSLVAQRYPDTNEQTFDSILKTGMSEKIRALRKALEASGGKNQAQPQAAYGKLSSSLLRTADP